MQRKKDVKGAVALLSDPQGELFKAMSAGGPEPILISSRLLLSRLLTELQKTTEAKAALAPLDGKEIPPALAWERFDLRFDLPSVRLKEVRIHPGFPFEARNS